jgi:hypothetical protein
VIILLSAQNYTFFRNILRVVPRWLVVMFTFIVLVFSSVVFVCSNSIISVLGFIIPLHYRSGDYYAGKLYELSFFYIVISFLILVLIFIRSRISRGIPLREFVFFSNIFLILFCFLLQNNFDIKNTFSNINKNRIDKIRVMSKRNSEYYEIIAAVVKNYYKSQTVLMMDPESYRATNYYLFTENNLFFESNEVPKIIYKKNDENVENLSADLIVYGKDDKVPEDYMNNFIIVYSGKYGSVLKLK